MFKRRMYLATLFAVIAEALAVGCGGRASPPTAAVRGRVTIDGEPLAAGVVRFAPKDGAGPVAIAVVTGGAYRLEKPNGPVVGVNSVDIDGSPVIQGVAIDDEAAYAQMIADGGGDAPANQVPPMYRTNSPVTFPIAGEIENVADFALTTPPSNGE